VTTPPDNPDGGMGHLTAVVRRVCAGRTCRLRWPIMLSCNGISAMLAKHAGQGRIAPQAPSESARRKKILDPTRQSGVGGRIRYFGPGGRALAEQLVRAADGAEVRNGQ